MSITVTQFNLIHLILNPMRNIFTTLSLATLLAFSVSTPFAIAQQKEFHAKNGMNAVERNYKTFTSYARDESNTVKENNKGYENHPEIGMVYAETPCDNCYELIGERTEMSKTYVKKGPKAADGGKDIYKQTSSGSMHYRDDAGNWRTIKTQLTPSAQAGVYSATEQPAPVTINTVNKYTSIGKAGENFTYNNDLELIYEQPDGTQTALGKANWSDHTAGDDGIYVKNAWPGIDIEIYTIRGATKTNFYINQAMPQYANGKLLVRDHMLMGNGLSLYTEGKSKLTGNMAIRSKDGSTVFNISAATAMEKRDIKSTLTMLAYYINGNTVDIALPGNFLNRSASAYPVIIDPLVSQATNTAVTGSTYSANWTVPCVYANAATVPANCTVTDIQWTFNYITSGGAAMWDGAVDFRLGACRSPTGATGAGGFYWFCNTFLTGTCTGSNVSIFADISGCVPPPQCPSYNLNMTMDFYQNYLSTAACATTYISAAIPLTITVIGHTVESNGVINAGASTICAGQSTTLSTSAIYGVPPYTFSWMPGSLAGTPVVVSPTATTTYTATVTDACGITATATSTITVNPITPITGTTTVCVGGTTALSNATGGGTWTSSNTSVATIGSSTGVVSGVSAGTTTITYTTATGCTATTTVTVTLLSGITGTTTICVNGTSALGNASGGGTWSSSNSGIASVNSTSGVVTGVSAGNVTITYATGSGCSTTIAFTVNPLPAAIVGPSAVCVGSTITLTDASTPGTWSSSTPGAATVSATGVVGGVAPGATTITYTLPTGCLITTGVSVNPIYSTSFSITICTGASVSFAGTTYTTTGVYPHLFTSIAGCDSVAALNLTVTPVTHTTVNDSICSGTTYSWGGGVYFTNGTYNHTFSNVNGCDSMVTLNLFIKPLPVAPLTADIDLCQNASPVFPLTAVGTNLLWYNVAGGGVGNPTAPVPATATPGTLTWYVSQVVNGCEGPRSPLNVVIHNKPNYTIVPGKPYECQFDTISLHYNGPMFPGALFTWTVPTYSTITGGTVASDPAIVVRFDTSLGNNTVYLTVGDGYTPCNSTVSYNVPVFLTAPPAYFNHNPNVCAGDSVLVALTYTSPGINDYMWNFDGGNIVVASSDHGGPYKVVWSTPGIYVITLNAVTNANCPASTIQDTVHVQPRPDARIAPYTLLNGKTSVCMGDSIIFSPLNFDDRYSYFWSPEHYFTQDNASHQYGVVDNPGYIKLTVRTPFGCPATDSILVDAQPCCTISFPTAFTPNGDGKNDVFRPITDGNHKIHFFRIANRWGQNVFESLEDGAGAWDGTYNGEKQDMDVYYYFISYDCSGKKIVQKGEVTLIR